MVEAGTFEVANSQIAGSGSGVPESLSMVMAGTGRLLSLTHVRRSRIQRESAFTQHCFATFDQRRSQPTENRGPLVSARLSLSSHGCGLLIARAQGKAESVVMNGKDD